jgi:NAD(P)H-hydrate epimerase
MMQLPPLTREQVRSIDRKAIDEYGMSGLVLMENAGRGCAESLFNLGIRGKVVIVCGKGNNGGDGFVIARHLDALGTEVHVVGLRNYETRQAIETTTPEASENLRILTTCSIYITSLSENLQTSGFRSLLSNADWVVDALLGTGTIGNPHPRIADIIHELNACNVKKLAVDLPSGLDCDTGIPGNPTFRADHTCTFVAPKVGFANPAAKEYLGTVSVHDIGVPRKLLEEFS